MKIRMVVKKKGSNDTWEEELDSKTTFCLRWASYDLTAAEYGQMVIDYFNNTLKPGETERELVSAERI